MSRRMVCVGRWGRGGGGEGAYKGGCLDAGTDEWTDG